MPKKSIYRNDGQLVAFTTNLIKAIPTVGKDCGLGDPEIKAITDAATALQTAIHADEQGRAAWRAAVAHTNSLKEQSLPEIERLIAKMRTSPAWNEEREHVLMLAPPAVQTLQPDTVKPKLALSVAGGKVRVDWTRGKLDGVNVYNRRRGEAAWRLLDRDNHPPYVDSTPLAQPGVPEVREYRLMGVWSDQEVGQPSDVASITVA